MNDDDLRAALSAYAATTPYLDPRDGLAARMTRHARARRAAVAAFACLAAVIAGTGVAALSDSSTTGLAVTGEGVPGESPSPSPTVSPDAAGEPTGTPAPNGHPSPDGGGHPGSPAASEPPPSPVDTSPITRTAEGPDGLRVRVTLTPGSVPTATMGRLAIHAEDDDAEPLVAMLSWGDTKGGPYAVRADDRACAATFAPYPPLTRTPTPAPPAPGEIDEVVEHAYRTPGRYTVRLRVVSTASCRDDVPEEDASLSFEIVVTPGAVTSNGPAEPRADLSVREDDGDMLRRYLTAHLNDPDGYVGEATVDWGDGSPATTIRNPEACEDGNGAHYPWDTWFWFPEIQHDYEGGGTYTVTVAGFSAGCDGADRQRVEERLEVEVA